MKITFFGAASEVGRSCIMVESGSTRIMLDAGVKIGAHDEYPLIHDSELPSVDAVVVSHAHLDHSAYLPHLFSAGYGNFVYTTKPTFELINVLTSDYIKISNPKNVTKEGIEKMQKHFKVVEYNETFTVKDMKIRLVSAGHILGSAMVEVSDGHRKLLNTGDVNFRTTKLLDGAATENLSADVLIMESTYGADKDVFPAERNVISEMAMSIKETILGGGKVMMPSFGVGRAQEMLLIIDDYMRSGLLPTVPIYTDGMVNKAMRIHRHNVIYCRDELQKRILLNDDDPFKSKNFVPVLSIQQRKEIMHSPEPSIIVTTSGMLTGGPILKYVDRLAGDAKNKIIFVGYQAEGTKGRELIEGAKSIKIGNKSVSISMAVEKYHLSAHADRVQLMHFVSKIKGLKEIFIIHGDRRKSDELAKAIGKKHNVHIPEPLATFTV